MNTISIEGKIVNHDQEFEGRIEIDRISGLIERMGQTTGKADLLIKNGLIFFEEFGED